MSRTLAEVTEHFERRAKEVGAAFLAGEAPLDIAARLDVHYTYVYRMLKHQGIRPQEVLTQRREAAKRERRAQIEANKAAKRAIVTDTVELYQSGVPLSDIAERYGITTEAVRLRLRKAGVIVSKDHEKEREHLFSELEFLCGTDSFEGLCQRLGTTTGAVEMLATRWGRRDLYERLNKTRINYTEDQNAA